MIKSRNGSATLMVLGTIAVLMILTSAFMVMFVGSQTRAIQSKNGTIALNLAEAGVDKALWELGRGNQEYRGEDRTPMGTGSFTVTLEHVSGLRNRIVITSAGDPGDRGNVDKTRTVRVEVAFSGAGKRFRINSMQWKKVHPSDN